MSADVNPIPDYIQLYANNIARKEGEKGRNEALKIAGTLMLVGSVLAGITGYIGIDQLVKSAIQKIAEEKTLKDALANANESGAKIDEIRTAATTKASQIDAILRDFGEARTKVDSLQRDIVQASQQSTVDVGTIVEARRLAESAGKNINDVLVESSKILDEVTRLKEEVEISSRVVRDKAEEIPKFSRDMLTATQAAENIVQIRQQYRAELEKIALLEQKLDQLVGLSQQLHNLYVMVPGNSLIYRDTTGTASVGSVYGGSVVRASGPLVGRRLPVDTPDRGYVAIDLTQPLLSK